MGLASYLCFFATVALTYGVAVLGLNLQWGSAGLFNVGVAGFAAVGAYVAAWITAAPRADALGRVRLADRARLDRGACWRRRSPPRSSARRRCGCAPTISPSPPSAPRSRCNWWR